MASNEEDSSIIITQHLLGQIDECLEDPEPQVQDDNNSKVSFSDHKNLKSDSVIEKGTGIVISAENSVNKFHSSECVDVEDRPSQADVKISPFEQLNMDSEFTIVKNVSDRETFSAECVNIDPNLADSKNLLNKEILSQRIDDKNIGLLKDSSPSLHQTDSEIKSLYPHIKSSELIGQSNVSKYDTEVTESDLKAQKSNIQADLSLVAQTTSKSETLMHSEFCASENEPSVKLTVETENVSNKLMKSDNDNNELDSPSTVKETENGSKSQEIAVSPNTQENLRTASQIQHRTLFNVEVVQIGSDSNKIIGSQTAQENLNAQSENENDSDREDGSDGGGSEATNKNIKRKLSVDSENDQEQYKSGKREKVSDGSVTDLTEDQDSSQAVVEDMMKTCDKENIASFRLEYNFTKQPGQITGAWQEFEDKDNNYLKGCKWSPDGTCILTNSDDNNLRLFNTPSEIYSGEMDKVPEMKSVLKMKGGETIYDYCWYPLMNSSDPESCCLISTCRCMPVHMWDAFTGELICSYKSYDQADELVAAHSVAFNPEGTKIYCGFNKTIRVFDISRPGRDFRKRQTFGKSVGQPGIISCIEFSPVDYSLYAAGSYSRSVALYYEPKGELAFNFTGHQGGVTHIKWSPDGTKLYTGARKDSEIICWDLRNPSKVLFTAVRKVETNQRIYFDIDRKFQDKGVNLPWTRMSCSTGQYLLSGNHDGTVSIWDVLNITDSRPQPILTYQAHHDTVNGISLHPSLPLLATSSGQRHFPMLGDSDDTDTEDLAQTPHTVDNSLGLWWIA